MLTSDLDVVNSGAAGSEKADTRTWHVLAICADARSNIESEILQRLASVRPGYRLIGLTYALLHGTAVIFLLVHESKTDDPQGLSAGQIPQHEKDRTIALVAYARLQVPTGQVARGSLAVRLHIAAEAIDDWDSSRMEEIGRRIETAAALAVEKEQAAISSANDSSRPDDPVINIDQIKKRWRRESVLTTEDQARDPERRSTTAQT
jgi:hypothetical protein